MAANPAWCFIARIIRPRVDESQNHWDKIIEAYLGFPDARVFGSFSCQLVHVRSTWEVHRTRLSLRRWRTGVCRLKLVACWSIDDYLTCGFSDSNCHVRVAGIVRGETAGECDFPDVILSRYRHRLEDDMPVGEGSKLEISQSGDASARVLLPSLAKQSTP